MGADPDLTAPGPQPAGRAADPMLFVIGHERSGTTMLRAMLDSHPDLAVPPEAHSVVRLLGRQPRPLDLDDFIEQVSADKYFADWQLPRPLLDDLRTDPRVRTTADAVAGLYALYARHHGKAHYGDKTPSHIVEIPLLAERFPAARFVNIVRDGRDVAASMVTMHFGLSDFDEIARNWRRRVLRARAAGEALGPDRFQELRYEDLVADPAHELARICAFAGLPYTDAMLDYHRRADELLDGVRHTQHLQGIRRPPTKNVRDWRTELDPHRQQVFDEIAGTALDAYGYPRSGLARSWSAAVEAGTVESRMRLRRARRVWTHRARRRLGLTTAERRPKSRTHTTQAFTTPPPRDLPAEHPEPTLDLSVVIPAYNAADTLAEQLDALLAEEYAGTWEIVVSDNGSTDTTRAIVASYTERDPRVRLVDSSARPGAAGARNAGAQAARGRLLAFCDADDIVVEGWLGAIARGLEDAEFVSGPFELDRLNPAWLVAAKGTTGTDGIVWFDDLFPFASSCDLGIHRDRFLAVGGFDERINVWEDVELSMRLFLEDVELVYLPDAGVHYRYRQSRSEFFARARAYGACRPQIAERLRAYAGIEADRWQGARNWAWLVKHLGDLGDETGQAHWLWTAGLRVGALEGSWLVRRVYL